MSAILIAEPLRPHLVLVRDLETGALYGIEPDDMVLLKDGSGERAKAGQCLRGERALDSAGRLVRIIRRPFRGPA